MGYTFSIQSGKMVCKIALSKLCAYWMEGFWDIPQNIFCPLQKVYWICLTFWPVHGIENPRNFMFMR